MLLIGTCFLIFSLCFAHPFEDASIKCTGKHEHYACGSACDNVCENLHAQNQTNCPIVNIKCNEMCYCDDGFARNENKECISIADCKHPICTGPNEYYSECTYDCPPELCVSLVAKYKCAEPQCKPGCKCDDGFLRRVDEESPCIPLNECPQMAAKTR